VIISPVAGLRTLKVLMEILRRYGAACCGEGCGRDATVNRRAQLRGGQKVVEQRRVVDHTELREVELRDATAPRGSMPRRDAGCASITPSSGGHGLHLEALCEVLDALGGARC
jgi:hypothetical protein